MSKYSNTHIGLGCSVGNKKNSAYCYVPKKYLSRSEWKKFRDYIRENVLADCLKNPAKYLEV